MHVLDINDLHVWYHDLVHVHLLFFLLLNHFCLLQKYTMHCPMDSTISARVTLFPIFKNRDVRPQTWGDRRGLASNDRRIRWNWETSYKPQRLYALAESTSTISIMSCDAGPAQVSTWAFDVWEPFLSVWYLVICKEEWIDNYERWLGRRGLPEKSRCKRRTLAVYLFKAAAILINKSLASCQTSEKWADAWHFCDSRTTFKNRFLNTT